MTSTSAFNNTFMYNGVRTNKSIEDMNDGEFQDLVNRSNSLKSRQQKLFGNNSIYANNGTSSSTKISSDFGGDWTQGNPNFSFDGLKNTAKDLAQTQLEIAKQQMDLSYGYRSKEKNLDDEITRRQSQQKFGFEESLQKLQQAHQMGMQSNEFNQQRTMFDKQDAAQQNQINSARSSASRLYFGGRPRPR